MSKVDFLWRVHGYVGSAIQFADAKAGAVIGLGSALAGALFAVVSAKILSPTFIALFAGATVLLTAAVVLAGISILPRLASAKGYGLIFWESVARYNGTEYRSAIPDGEADVELEVARHVVELSGICTRKHRLVRIALLTFFCGGVLAVACIARVWSTQIG